MSSSSEVLKAEAERLGEWTWAEVKRVIPKS